MLAKRIIPCLDIKDGRVVKGVNFINLQDAGDPVENAKIYQQEGADELAFLDITASSQGRKTVVDLVERVAQVVSIPLTVGGGIKTIADIGEVLSAGADRVSINTAAVENPKLITEASTTFGSQSLVVAIDAKSWESASQLQWQVYIQGGKTSTGLDAVSWAKEAESLGAGEILLTSVDCDGTKNGFDIPLTKAISEAVDIPVIASGGAGNIAHFCEVFKRTKASAALAASIFHYREVVISKLKQRLVQEGVKVRV